MARPKPNSQIAARLKEARLRLYATASQAAEALGVNATTLRTHEAGTRGIPFDEMERYARRYGVALDWLISGKGEQEPNLENRTGFAAEQYGIAAVIQDDRWYPGSIDDEKLPGMGMRVSASGLPEVALYDDPRFPPSAISAYLVRTDRKDGPYLDGTVVFLVGISAIGLGIGDHVVILRHRNGFVEWTLRELLAENKYKRLLSEGPEEFDAEDDTWVAGVVVGAVVRRPVPSVDIQSRKNISDADLQWVRNKKRHNAT